MARTRGGRSAGNPWSTRPILPRGGPAACERSRRRRRESLRQRTGWPEQTSCSVPHGPSHDGGGEGKAREKMDGEIEIDTAPQEDDEASEAAAQQIDRPDQGDLRAHAAKEAGGHDVGGE